MKNEKEEFNTPILFLIFNRPDTTKLVFEAIRKMRPSKIFIAADGPRSDKSDDIENCSLARNIIKDIDWSCEIKTLFRETNLGCRYAPSSAISWFFEHVDAGIIIEDDIVPDESFFRFCEELLDKYKDNDKIMHISGNNFQQNNREFVCKESYYFSKIPQVWGWATWKRAWDLYDVEIKKWPEIKKRKLFKHTFNNNAVALALEELMEKYYRGKNSWDGQWMLACIEHGLCINPRFTLTTNIGFDERATHTSGKNHKFANLPVKPITFPLIHPQKIEINTQADNSIFKNQFEVNRSVVQQIKNFFKTKFTKKYLAIRKIIKKY